MFHSACDLLVSVNKNCEDIYVKMEGVINDFSDPDMDPMGGLYELKHREMNKFLWTGRISKGGSMYEILF